MNLSGRRPIRQDELAEIMAGMDQAEKNGVFDGLFSREQVVTVPAASRETLLKSIHPDMKLTKGFFLKVYGYEISFPGFADQAIKVLMAAGCSKAQGYYSCIKAELDFNYEKGIKGAGIWYLKELQSRMERKVSAVSAGNRNSRYQFTGFPEDW